MFWVSGGDMKYTLRGYYIQISELLGLEGWEK